MALAIRRGQDSENTREWRVDTTEEREQCRLPGGCHEVLVRQRSTWEESLDEAHVTTIARKEYGRRWQCGRTRKEECSVGWCVNVWVGWRGEM